MDYEAYEELKRSTRAKWTLHNRKKRGLFDRTISCEVCARTSRIEGHHDD